MSYTLKPFQLLGVRMLKKTNGRTILADEPGLGKTAQCLTYAVQAATWPVVVVCPAVAKYTWQQEAAQLYGLRCVVLEGTKPEPLNKIHTPNLIAINYDILQYWLPQLKKINPQLIVIDESQYISNPKAIRTESVVALCKGVDKVIAVSGTPLTNRPIELYQTLKLIWPKEFPAMGQFGTRYCQPQFVRGRIEYRGAKNLNELHTRLKDLGMIRRTKADVLSELPDKTRHMIPIPLDDPNKTYRKLEGDFRKVMSDAAKERHVKIFNNAVLGRLGDLKRTAAKLKFKNALKWIDDLLAETEQKVVLFAWHRKCIEALARHYAGRNVIITGDTPAKDRHLAVKRFQNDPKYDVFIGNLQAASTNITLTAASRVVKVELDWRPGVHLQAEDRIHRIGQKNAADIYYLVGKGTIEEDICQMLQRKQANITKILDGGVDADFNIFDELAQELAKHE
jgi:SWI/SNF-related matrix-associated actin-dependent regulator 1 of chromatin subfamily A